MTFHTVAVIELHDLCTQVSTLVIHITCFTETSVVVLGHKMGTVSELSLQYLEAPPLSNNHSECNKTEIAVFQGCFALLRVSSPFLFLFSEKKGPHIRCIPAVSSNMGKPWLRQASCAPLRTGEPEVQRLTVPLRLAEPRPGRRSEKRRRRAREPNRSGSTCAGVSLLSVLT